MPSLPPLPTIGQLVFAGFALFTCASALGVVLAPNLFHGALALVATLFGVAGLYVMLEAEFLAVSQVLVYVGAIATLIVFAVMLTRSMMYGKTSPLNRQWGKTGLFAVLIFLGLYGFIGSIPWADSAAPVLADESMIAALGVQFVTDYVVAFEVLGLLLLVALVGAVMLARDNN
ncbi:MAG: NADH-quinone oxidoreductase subunit J [Caldilineaceae bacterium]|nr:NADH-quinone oxidoreductase subunit J [Caldilineaceae bacterium]